MRGRRLIVQLHLWLGLLAAIPIIVVSFTGVLLTFERELKPRLATEFMTVAADGAYRPFAELEARVSSAFPDDEVQKVALPEVHGRAIRFDLDSGRSVYVDPYAGRLLGVRDEAVAFFGIVASIHFNLLMEETGTKVVVASTLALILLLISGVYLWWPRGNRKRQAFVLIWRGSILAKLLSLHKTLGLYSAIIVLIIAWSAIEMYYEAPIMAAVKTVTAAPEFVPPERSPVERSERITLDRAILAGKLAVPGSLIRDVMLPAAEGYGVVRIRVRPPGEPWHAGRTFVYVDARTGEFLAIDDGARGPAPSRTKAWLYHLHLGHWGEVWSYSAGVVTRLLWMIVTLMPIVLAGSGAWLWWKGRKKAVGSVPSRNSLRDTIRPS